VEDKATVPNTESSRKEDAKDGSNPLEKLLQILSVTIFVTYVSGYLVTSTFLNSFGIVADASDFLKARYLYVGFLYLLFMAAVGLAFGFVAVLYDYIRSNCIQRSAVPLGKTPRPLKHRYVVIWSAIGLFFASSEAIQIMLLNLQNFRNYILLQTGLLAGFLFYQLMNARSLHHVGWDRNRYVRKLYGWCALSIVVFALMPAVFYFVPSVPERWIPYLLEHYRYVIVAGLNILLLVSFRLGIPFLYTGSSLRARRAFNHAHLKWWQGIGPRRAIWFAVALSLANLIFLPYKWRWLGLQIVHLTFTSAALASIIFMSIAYTRDRQQGKISLSNSERWTVWFLRIAAGGTLYVASAIAYANVVYPLIPFAKSGGDFRTAAIVRVHFRYGDDQDSTNYKSEGNSPIRPAQQNLAGTSQRVHTDVEPEGEICQPGVSLTCDDLVILDESPDVVYFARVNDALSLVDGKEAHGTSHGVCGPELWTRGIRDPNGPYRPHLIAIERRDILSIEDVGSVTEAEGCH